MKHPRASILAAAVVGLSMLALLATPCAAQSKAERAPAPEVSGPGARGESKPAPARPRPREVVPNDDTRSDREDGADTPQEGCPYQGRPLELIV